MPFIRVEIPDGNTCNGCRFNQSGTVWCDLFCSYLVEDETCTDIYKCEDCLERCKEDGDEKSNG